MSISKILGVISCFVLAIFLYFNWPGEKKGEQIPVHKNDIEEVALPVDPESEEIVTLPIHEEEVIVIDEQNEEREALESKGLNPISDDKELPPDVDRMSQLFQPFEPLLPIMETVSYTSRVPWVTGRAAYLGDYAAHYKTSKHFISRSLNGIGNYLSDVVSKGDRFNVFRDDKEIEFHLVLDLSRLKLWVYCYDVGEEERYLLKSYPVSAGKLDPRRPSGSLTPTGVFALGNEIAVYKDGVMGTFRNEPCEMITIFGKRWIPFIREVANCTGSCKGIGFHGVPWKHALSGDLVEARECIGNYESSGCIRLLSEDMEELFAVVVSRPAFVHVVRDFTEAKLPGKEKA